MKPSCQKCKNIIPGTIKLNAYRKTIGKKSKSVIDYYCEACFVAIEEERAWNVYRKKEEVIKGQIVRRLRRKQRKVH